MPFWLGTQQFEDLLQKLVESCASVNKELVITFDDGNVSDLTLAAPILKNHGLTATFFVCRNFTEKAGYLTFEQMRNLQDLGMSIGSHGQNHVDWRHCSTADLHAEIHGAYAELNQNLNHKINALAIPFGSYDRRVISSLKKSDAKFIFSSDQDTPSVRDLLTPRFTITRDWNDEKIKRNLAIDSKVLPVLKRKLIQFAKRQRNSPSGRL